MTSSIYIIAESCLEGIHLADISVFISCALSLAVFDITKCVENGVVVEPVHDNTTGTIRCEDFALFVLCLCL